MLDVEEELAAARAELARLYRVHYPHCFSRYDGNGGEMDSDRCVYCDVPHAPALVGAFCAEAKQRIERYRR